MAKTLRNFVSGRMNKMVDQRVLPEGEYVDAMNIRMGSTELSEIGVIENSKGNLPLTSLSYIDGTSLSANARCIGSIEDNANDLLYWFVHDPTFPVGATGKLDLILSYNVFSGILTYHIISVDDGGGVNTTLNFNMSYLITGINILGPLLFYTEDYNPPRFMNTHRNYANPIANIDQITAEQLLVIKKPPTQSPTVTPIVTSGQENYLDTRFICFAYRYRYIDGEYSATSQWSQVTFVPNPFSFSINSMLNEGMTNLCNSVIIEYNSGGPLVVGIDLLFKQSVNNIIKVIEKLDKADLGIANNTIRQYTFTNSKIFTILSEAELLRLYDNVPLIAKAQTIMGNRLMYGNYVEGWDLIDKNGSPTKFEYTTSLITKKIGSSSIPDNLDKGNYNLDAPLNVPNAILYIDLVGKVLKEGSAINIQFTIVHNQFTGDTPFPSETTQNIGFTFSFLLTRNYTSVYQLATSTEFQLAIGTAANIKPVYSAVPGTETSCDGTTLTDQFNCVLPQNLNALQKFASGITALNQAIAIITTPSSSQIGFQFPAMLYVDTPSFPIINIYEYYSVVFANATFQEISNPKSLHSNRGYEIGIVYMDEFNRATTALVSPNNTVHIPCGYSANKNSIQVTIPIKQKAPAFAKRYKFVIKPDSEIYEVIYCNLFFTDPNTNEVWFYLEGENQKKVEVGDRYIVKADSGGVVQNCAYATVLEKAAKGSAFIVPIENVVVPAGVYMKINPSTFNAIVNPNAVIIPGSKQECAPSGGNYRKLSYPMNITGTDALHPTWTFVDYTIPAGSKIRFNINWDRLGTGGSCERRGYLLEKNYVASANYDNMEDWFRGDNIFATLNSGISRDGDTKLEFLLPNAILNTYDFNINYLQFYRNPTTNELILQFSTGQSCTGIGSPNSRQYCVTADIQVFRAESTIIFETQPLDAAPDIWYENNLSFGIDIDGHHNGNVQNQTATVPAIIDTGFFNCFAFGNGAESYKIRDSIIGKPFSLGERVTGVAVQEYKKADKFADITYSGIYNAQSNVNKLNQFNAGLLNYKNCETSFGEIFILDGRQTDVLVLQEDKISYVLAGKNLLSDSTGGGVIASVPEVLGTQIARTEKYGISFNPESYVQWGYDRYFTDAKRGAVVQLKGDSYNSDQIRIISESGMRTWFRDMFNKSFSTQKLGAFDPYMNEYVLSSNNELLPYNAQCLSCGVFQTFTLSIAEEVSKEISYCVNLGPVVGFTEVSWNFSNIQVGKTLNVIIYYDGNTITSGPISTDGNIMFNKNNISVQTATITLRYTGDMVVNVLADCTNAEQLNVVQILLTNNSEASDTVHLEYRFTDGDFVSPLQSTFVTFASGMVNPLVSLYNITTGLVGSGAFPPAGSNVSLISNKFATDTYNFVPTNKFKYYRTNDFYDNNVFDINTLLGLAMTATPNLGSGSINFADFTNPLSGLYLYLIWDFRTTTPAQLCLGISVSDVCCFCGTTCLTPYNGYTTTNNTGDIVTIYYYNESGVLSSFVLTDGNDTYFCSIGTPYSSNPSLVITFDGCGCNP